MKKVIYIGLAIFAIIAGITLGIIVHVYNDEKMEQATLEQVKEAQRTILNNTIVQTATVEEKKVSPNAIITFETYYTKCGHSDVKKKRVDVEDVNLTETEIKEKYQDYTLKTFSDDEIVFYQEVNKMCENHFIVREKEGQIAVYQIDEDENEILKTQTDISTKYLPEEDIELLKKGIKANSQSQLQQILSDYE